MSFYAAAITLILVMDPFGNIPMFLSLLSTVDNKRRKRIILREMAVALAILVLFLFVGKYILSGLHISEPALSIAGGVILLLISIKMIFPGQKTVISGEETDSEPIVVPMAVPLIAGPSTMSVLILFSTQYPDRLIIWFFALILAWGISLGILMVSDALRNFLGNRVLKAIERLMGMILTTLSVQMLLSGLENFISSF